MMRLHGTRFLAVLLVFSAASAARAQLDGTDLPTKYAGFSAAVQTCQTGYGNATVSNVPGIISGSELDAMYVSSDAENVWIGITGNLPSQLAFGESIIVLIQTVAGGAPGLSNVLDVTTLAGDGGGFFAMQALNGMVLDAAFIPDKVLVFNRYYDGVATTSYFNAWDMAQASPYAFNIGHVAQTPTTSCALLDACISDDVCIMSAFMNATNLLGVDADETKDGAVQAGLAATALKGLRIRLSRNCFAINDPVINIMAVVSSPDRTISNQFLPPLTNGEDPAAPACYVGYTDGNNPGSPPNLDTMTGNQYATVNLAAPGHDTPPVLTAGGGDGSGADNIPAQWGAGALVATQTIHTCFGNAQNGIVQLATPGSELDQLFVRNADLPVGSDYLHLAVTGNLERNGNKVYILIDSKAGGENPFVDTNGDGSMTTWNGRGVDTGFLPDFAYVINNSNGTLFVDMFDIAANTATYLGAVGVNATGGVLDGGTNVNNNLFSLNNTNTAGVAGFPSGTGDPLTATTGLEARISMTELGVNLAGGGVCPTIGVMVILGNQTGEWMSNQCLPGFVAGTGNINNDPTTKFNFGDNTQLAGAFTGNQYVSYTARRIGDLTGDCCINSADTLKLVEVLLGTETNGQILFRADLNQDGKNDGRDIKPFVDRMIATNPCS